jgi:hypothetical protein
MIRNYLVYFNNPLFLFSYISNIYFYLALFSIQSPILILCIIIKKLLLYNDTITFKYFLKEPFLYILLFSLLLFPILYFLIYLNPFYQ